MGQLSARLGVILRVYGWDPAAWQGDLQALASLEGSDPKAALARFHDLKRGFAAQRRADLFRSLAGFPFVRGVPPPDTQGMGLKEVEGDVRAALRALPLARAAAAALAEADALREGLALRAPPPATPLPDAPWDALGPVAEAAEARRRAVAREARLEARLRQARRDAARLRHHKVEMPDLSSEAVPDPAEADARLAPLEERLRVLLALEEAHEAACAPLRSAEVREWKRESRKALEAEAKALLAGADAAEATRALRALAGRAEALRVEAAKRASEAVRARRSGRAPPVAERRPGDMLDPYG